MAQYLVEAYMSRRESRELRSLVARALGVAASMRRDGTDVHYLGPILVPEDETCFHLLDAPSLEAVAELNRRLDIVHERIVEALAWADETQQGRELNDL